jgi:hypothetical protein
MFCDRYTVPDGTLACPKQSEFGNALPSREVGPLWISLGAGPPHPLRPKRYTDRKPKN